MIADEQTTIYLYKGAGLIPVRLVANDLVDRSFGDAIAGVRATAR